MRDRRAEDDAAFGDQDQLVLRVDDAGADELAALGVSFESDYALAAASMSRVVVHRRALPLPQRAHHKQGVALVRDLHANDAVARPHPDATDAAGQP